MSSIVVRSSDGYTIHSENPHQQRQPASLTKIMTLRLLFKALQEKKISLNTQFPVSVFATKQIPSKLNLRAGERITIKSIIEALVTKWANDVAVVAAEGLAGSVPAFVEQMNRETRALGMHRTNFQNASGVPNSKQLTTAHDMVLLSQAMYQDYRQYWPYFKLQHFNYGGHTHRNHNHLLGKVPGVDGIKTGYVNASRFNISTSAQRFCADGKPVRLFVVVMGGDSAKARDTKAKELLNNYFSRERAFYVRVGQPTSKTQRTAELQRIVPPSPLFLHNILQNEKSNRAVTPVIQKAGPIAPVMQKVSHYGLQLNPSVKKMVSAKNTKKKNWAILSSFKKEKKPCYMNRKALPKKTNSLIIKKKSSRHKNKNIKILLSNLSKNSRDIQKIKLKRK